MTLHKAAMKSIKMMAMQSVIALLLGGGAAAQTSEFDFYLVLGQSNAAGRVAFSSTTSDFAHVPYTGATASTALFDGTNWVAPAQNLPSSGNNLDLGFNRFSPVRKADKEQWYNFGLSLLRNLDVSDTKKVGLLFHARGATTIDQWDKNHQCPTTNVPCFTDLDNPTAAPALNLYNSAVKFVERAARTSSQPRLAGIIWVIGESDALYHGDPSKDYTYSDPSDAANALFAINQSLRESLKVYSKYCGSSSCSAAQRDRLPIHIVQIPYFDPNVWTGTQPDWTGNNRLADKEAVAFAHRFNQRLLEYAAAGALPDAPTELRNIYITRSSSTGKMDVTQPNRTHWDHAGADAVGARLAAQIKKAAQTNTAVSNDWATESGDFPSAHYCATNIHWICDNLKKLRKIQLGENKKEDLVILPHRGLWGNPFMGTNSKVPENSLAAIEYIAMLAQYPWTELDFMPTAEVTASDQLSGGVLSHDYVVHRLTNASGAQTSWRFPDKTKDDIQTLKLLNRDGSLSDQDVASVRKALVTANETGLTVFVDIKQRPTVNDPASFAVNWVLMARRILHAAETIGGDKLLAQLVFKTSFSPAFIKANLGSYENSFRKVGWMPQVASNGYYNYESTSSQYPTGMGTMNWIRSSLDYIAAWESEHEVIAAFETNYKDDGDSRRQVFDWDYCYINILDYLHQTTGRRGGVFAEEPVGSRGIVNREAKWEMKNTSTDHRGDPLFESASLYLGNTIVVTTDRTDVWEQVRGLYNVYNPFPSRPHCTTDLD
jgi:glycerophosphoryl diester phosphodiesterase